MPARIMIICLLVFLCFLKGADAEDNSVEIIQKKGFLLLGDIEPWLGLTYEYIDHTSGQNSGRSSSNQLEEIYHIDTSAAILDPHLFNFSIGGDIWFQQEEASSSSQGSSSGNGVKYTYSFAGSAYDNRWYPINMFSSLTTGTVQTPFSQPYNTETGRHGIEFLVLKDPFRLKMKYERDTLDFTGGNQVNNQVTDSFEFLGSHNYRDISSTSVNATFSNENSVYSGVRQAGTALLYGYTNSLYLGRLRNYLVTSTLQSNDQTYGGAPQKTLDVTETFQGHPGKALDLELDYRYNHNLTGGLYGLPDQVYNVNSGLALLRHRLFESLITELRGNLSQNSFLGGSEDIYAGTVKLQYRKKLSATTNLTVETYGTHQITDRKLAENEQSVANERSHTATQLNQVITLNITGPLQPGSVLIQGFAVAPINPQQDPPTITFTENVDYQVDYPLGRITWIGFPLPTVPNLVISYTVLFDQSVKYATDTGSLSSTLYLANGKYALSGLYYNQNQHVLSGQSQYGLFNTSIAQLRFQGFLGANSYSLEYDDYHSGPTKYRYFEGWWQYDHVTPGMSLLFLGRDRYSMYDATSTSGSYDNNSLNLSASYNRDLSDWSNLILTFLFLDLRGGPSGTSDSISVRAGLRARFNRLTVNLLGSSGWRFDRNSASRDDYIRLEVRRYF